MTRILLVDDETLILYSPSKTLKHAGFDVTAVTTGREALREISASPYGIRFLDVNLPDANGLDLMETIQKDSPCTAIIIMTAVYLDENKINFLQSRGCRYLPKPFEIDEVLAMVRDISGKQSSAAGGV
ncbi:MAG: response regulator [Nitrospirota bacterium]|nr:response regulator [Nitrospirota bacterium]